LIIGDILKLKPSHIGMILSKVVVDEDKVSNSLNTSLSSVAIFLSFFQIPVLLSKEQP